MYHHRRPKSISKLIGIAAIAAAAAGFLRLQGYAIPLDDVVVDWAVLIAAAACGVILVLKPEHGHYY